MISKFDKARWILTNEGPVAFGKKSAGVVSRKLGLKQAAAQTNEAYQYLSNPLFSITHRDIAASQKASSRQLKEPASVLWFVPYFDHVTYGGIYTIFRFIEYFANKGLKTTIVIFDNKYFDAKKMRQDVAQHFPGLAQVNVINFNPGSQPINELPECDIAFSTIWMSAYLLLRYNQAKRKYYFVQDYEPLFYEAGSMYALAESTYRFGFTGIVNTPGLLRAINERHGMKGTSFIPAVDKTYYYPNPSPESKTPTRVFFYARPNNPRNAFELGVLTIQQLKKKYGNSIEIITAGADWDESTYGLKDQITNLGLLGSLEEVGDLYRSCDIGFVYMLSKHPSYQPFEFMACGVATVSNRNEDNLWLLKDGQNCLLAEPNPGAMAEQIGKLVDDEKLRQKIALAGQRDINFDWQLQLEEIWNYVHKN
jgi:O-antigen biosynthesis protein